MASPIVSYVYPPVNPSVTANFEQWREFQPTNGTTNFRTDNSQLITFNIASNSEFMRSTMSFLSFTLTCRDNANAVVANAGTRNSKQGVTRIFDRIRILIGSTVIEDLEYADLCALWYPTFTTGRKSFMAQTEGYGNDSLMVTGSRKFAIPLHTSLFTTEQAIPLPLIQANGGLTVELYLAQSNNFITTTTATVPYMTVDMPRIKSMMITPDPAFTAGLVNSVLRGGRSAYLATNRIRVFRTPGNGSTTQQITIPIGGVSSINSVETAFYSDAKYVKDGTTLTTPDRFKRFEPLGLVDYKVEIAGMTQPASLTFSGDVNNPEATLMSLLTETGNIYRIGDSASVDADYNTTAFRIALNFQASNETYKSGISTLGAASGNIQITTNHTGAVNSNQWAYSVVTTDQLVEFTSGVINVTEVF